MNSQQSPDEASLGRVIPPTWCPGCGNFGILEALRRALRDLGAPSHEVLVVSGIGCGSKLPDYVEGYGLMTIHGRPLPVATGAKLARPGLRVIVVSGDGDAYGIGGNHLVHTARRSPDITHIVQNNQVFGLTGGQRSFTAGPQPGRAGVTEDEPTVGTALALAAGAGFIARALATDIELLTGLIGDALRFPGYALVDVLQTCVTFGTPDDEYRRRTYQLAERDHGDIAAAHSLSREWNDRVPLGVLYRSNEPRPTLESRQQSSHAPHGSSASSYARILDSMG